MGLLLKKLLKNKDYQSDDFNYKNYHPSFTVNQKIIFLTCEL
ncbi:hypothetical protein TRIP_D260172 [uncultured Paludibacter sp.]|uniref:Uncharacterized protein n=1 Tax=uncultured Paludibacter sp. TaxID=497635 RepID=A0A653AA00_9BACT|nr:hypothetical protein TRIP_D260172 [uncultured Paludibacter sp.]